MPICIILFILLLFSLFMKCLILCEVSDPIKVNFIDFQQEGPKFEICSI